MFKQNPDLSPGSANRLPHVQQLEEAEATMYAGIKASQNQTL